MYGFQQAKPIRKLTNIQIGLAYWNRNIEEKLAHKVHIKFFLGFCRKSCPHLGSWLNPNLNGQIVIAICRIQKEAAVVLSIVKAVDLELKLKKWSEIINTMFPSLLLSQIWNTNLFHWGGIRQLRCGSLNRTGNHHCIYIPLLWHRRRVQRHATPTFKSEGGQVGL